MVNDGDDDSLPPPRLLSRGTKENLRSKEKNAKERLLFFLSSVFFSFFRTPFFSDDARDVLGGLHAINIS